MLDRLRRKLYLSVKVMGSDNTAAQSTADLGLKELLDILRKGSSALSFQGMDLAKFLKADIQEILDLSRSRDSARDAKIHSDNAGEADERLVQDAEEEQRNLLSGVAQVQCRLFEDRVVQRQYKGNATIANEWQAIQKRAQLEKTVLVNGVRIASVHVASVVSVSAGCDGAGIDSLSFRPQRHPHYLKNKRSPSLSGKIGASGVEMEGPC